MNRLVMLPVLWLYATLSLAAEIPEVVRTCMEKNTPATSSLQSIELRARDRSGYEQVLEANTYWKRGADNHSSILMHFNEPVDIRGARFLIIENTPQNDMYMYMPGLFKVRKITSKRISSSILGTDFSYEDYERLHGVFTNTRAEQYPDEVLDGRPVHVINSYPEGDSGYEKIKTYIDIETCVALRTELFESGHQLRKTLTVNPADIRKEGEIYVPRTLLMRDLRDKTETRMLIQEIKTDVVLEDDLFDPAQLKQKKAPVIPTD
ncbi:MAG: outer membrane lipoprotein-sorting protein [Gammaproteobacteria bacterium]